MKSFFKYTFAVILGSLLSFFIAILIIVGIAAALSHSTESTIEVKDNSILKIKLNGIIDREPLNIFSNFNFGQDNDNSLKGLNVIIKSIENAKNDSKIKGIYLDAENIGSGGLASLESVRNALLDFKTSGKFIYSYSEYYSQKDYYLASVSDKIFVNPAGGIEIKGIGAQIMFFKNAMDKLGVEMQIIRGPNNKYKSAVEPFMYNKMSDANKLQTLCFINSIWQNMSMQISKSRKLSMNDFKVITDSLLASNPEKAKEFKLVDELTYYDQFSDSLAKKMGEKSLADVNIINIKDYSTTVKQKNISSKNKIAVIYAVGEIQSGKGDDETIGSERISQAISKARKDSNVKAIVLRVNSPGGSALASEIIWRELVLAKKDKPIVVSMGDYAASGGYYISCMADRIIAEKTTITGSIGVFGMIPNMQKLLNDKLGITTDQVSTNANSTIGVYEPLTSVQLENIQKQIIRTYNTFINHVAEGRHMTPESVDAIAQGRVWSAEDALKAGLVDDFGDLNYAIETAADLAKVKDDYRTVEMPNISNPFDKIMSVFGNSIKTKFMSTELSTGYNYFNYLQSIQKMEGVQARIPYFIDIN